MKKTTKLMYVMGFCLLLLTTSCKKNEPAASITVDKAMVKKQQAARGSSSRNADDAYAPNATVAISEELYDALVGGSFIQLTQEGETFYQAVDIINGPDEPYDPSDPTGPIDPAPDDDPCSWNNLWDAFYAYLASKRADFEAWANLYCKPYRGSWSKCGLCILFEVAPTDRWKCPGDVEAYTPEIPMHGVPGD